MRVSLLGLKYASLNLEFLFHSRYFWKFLTELLPPSKIGSFLLILEWGLLPRTSKSCSTSEIPGLTKNIMVVVKAKWFNHAQQCFHRTSIYWNFLSPSSIFPKFYNIQLFKCKVNKYLLSLWHVDLGTPCIIEFCLSWFLWKIIIFYFFEKTNYLQNWPATTTLSTIFRN